MKEKLPVIGHEQIAEAVKREEAKGIPYRCYADIILEAQRDAAAAYYENEEKELTDSFAQTVREMIAQNKLDIQQAKAEVFDEIQAGAVSVANLIEAARHDVAREMVEEVERYFNDRDKRSVLILQTYPASEWWQSLKDKWLKEEYGI